MVRAYCERSVLGRALKEGKFGIEHYNPADYTEKGVRADDRAYGGGPGMVLRAEPVLRAFSAAKGRKRNVETLFFDCGGKRFDGKQARALARGKHIILICGRYEGIDARVQTITGATPIRVGDATLTGGEIPAMFVIDAVARTLSGVLGNEQSPEDKRCASHSVYTRPQTLRYKGKSHTVPEVLLSGHHREIEQWRKVH